MRTVSHIPGARNRLPWRARPSSQPGTMGAADSNLLAYQVSTEQVTTVRARDSATTVDACLIALQQLVLRPPLLIPQSSDVSLKDMLLRKSSSFSSSKDYGALDPTTTLHLYELYQQWQEKAASKVCKVQDELGKEIEGVEAFELKLLQRLNFATSVIKSTAVHLQDVLPLRVEVAQMKRNLHATIQSYNTLCTKIEELESSSLREKEKPRRISLASQSASKFLKEAGPSQPSSRSSFS